MAWEATLDVEAPSLQPREIPEQGRTHGLEDAPELGGAADMVSDPTTPRSRLGRENLHQLRVVSPITQASDDFRAEGVESNDTSTAGSESSDSDYFSQAESDVSTLKSGALSDMSASDGEALGDASSPESGARTPTVVQTAARKVGAHMSVPGDGEELREGRGRAQTRRSTGEPPRGCSVRSGRAKEALYVR